jgi:hypothetical protein
MSPAELFYINSLERQVSLLLHAARVARSHISSDRESLYQCECDPVRGAVVDQLGLEAIAEYDDVLALLDNAIATTESGPRAFYGLVEFKLTENGWRVIRCVESGPSIQPLPLHHIKVGHWKDLLIIEGTFHRRPRLHTFCKRPHKEIAHA